MRKAERKTMRQANKEVLFRAWQDASFISILHKGRFSHGYIDSIVSDTITLNGNRALSLDDIEGVAANLP